MPWTSARRSATWCGCTRRVYRPLLIALDVALAPTTVRADVAAELARLLSSGWLADGTPALFNPAKLGFATPVYSSPIIAATHGVAGVRSAVLRRFGFLGEPQPAGDAAIAASLTRRRARDRPTRQRPDAAEHGYALVTLEGGR